MLLTKLDLERRLNSQKNLLNVLPMLNNKGRPEGSQNTPLPIKAVAGALARQGEKVRDISEALGVSPSVVREAKNSKNEEVRNKVDNSLDRVRELALDRLMSSLGLLTDDKIMNEKPKDISAIAANMAKIVERTQPRASETTNVQFVVYAPQSKSEREYKTIEI